MEYSIQTIKYEGPMDLLFDLINRNKIDIRDISIFEITEQYVEYVDNMQEVDLELASDFIAMAAKLIEIKSRYILYVKNEDEEEADPRLELVQQIEEYRKFKAATEVIQQNIKEFDDVFYREKAELPKDEDDYLPPFPNITMDEIKKILKKISDNLSFEAQEHKDDISDEKLNTIVRSKTVSVEEKIESLRKMIHNHENISFSSILKEQSRKEIVASFLAILEMIKLKEIFIKQDRFLEDIFLSGKMDSGEDDFNKTLDNDETEKKALHKLEKKEKKSEIKTENEQIRFEI